MKEKNLLFKDWGVFVNTNNNEQYEIKKVIIFKDNQEKIIANYFLDNFNNYQFEYFGDTKRKLKKDLTLNHNFVIKSDKQDSWNDKTQYDLYINGDINNYKFLSLELIGDRLDITFSINDLKCSQCIGWNHKNSNKAKYQDFENAYKNINLYSIDSEKMESNIKELLKAYNKYKKEKEIEKTYTVKDYKKMQLESGTTKEENITMLKNNGFDVKGIN